MSGKTCFRAVALTALLLCAFGCAKAEAKGTGEEQNAPGNERTKLTFLTAVNVDTEGVDVNDSPYVKYLEDKFDVDLEIVNEPVKYAEKLNTTMASGKLPDYFDVLTKNDLLHWADEKMIMPLDRYLPQCPDLTSQISPLAWDLSSYNGETVGIPLLRYDATPLMTFVRKDWLENLHIDPDKVNTVDEWYDMLHALTYGDPDGNGKDDTYGLAASQDSFNAAYLTFLDAFGGATAQVVDGKVIPYYLTDGYRDYLKFMHRLYEEKILDPKYLITSNQQLWDEINSGKAGSFLWFWMTSELRSKGFDTNNLVAMKPPLRADGTRSFYKYTSPIRTYTALSSQCRHPEKVMEMLNWACTEEGGVFVFAGIEGLDYTRNADGSITIKEGRKGKNTSLRFILLGCQKPKIDTPMLQDIMRQAWGDNGLSFLEESSECGGYDETELKAPYFPELALYDIDHPVSEFRDKAIMGKVDIDAEWDSYVQRIRNAGAAKKIDLMTDWYDTNR